MIFANKDEKLIFILCIILYNSNDSNMGIRYLNKYIRRNCLNNIVEKNLHDFNGHKIVIDASIYIYRFKSEDYLIDGIYQMTIEMRKSGITPVFVFDGKPPQEKLQLLQNRQKEKRDAILKMDSMYKNIQDNRNHVKYRDYIECKRKCVRVYKSDIDNVKQLLTLCGVTWYQAEGEADELCARLVIKKRAWACMSDDLDLLVYGCPRVIRSFDLYTCNCLLYDTFEILKSLDVNIKEFREICVVSGCDYNSEDYLSFNKTIKLFYDFKKNKNSVIQQDFYEWLDFTENYKSNIYKLYVAELAFDTSSLCLASFDNNPIENKKINKDSLKEFLWKYNYVFQ